MNDYYSLRIEAHPCNEDITDLIAALLADIGYETFEPDSSGVTAYIAAKDFSFDKAIAALSDFPIPTSLNFSYEFIKGKDWNEEWEKNYFKPIAVDDQCVIHSSFHHDYPAARYDIVIDPKMAFGTGHHSTTTLMLRYILADDMIGKDVIDMGTGTGILAILCAMCGASSVTGIEIDESAWTNAVENCRLNNVEISLIHGDASALSRLPKCDRFFANINRNIILNDIDIYSSVIKPGGIMYLSGFYAEDVPMVKDAATKLGFELLESNTNLNWCALKLIKL